MLMISRTGNTASVSFILCDISSFDLLTVVNSLLLLMVSSFNNCYVNQPKCWQLYIITCAE